MSYKKDFIAHRDIQKIKKFLNSQHHLTEIRFILLEKLSELSILTRKDVFTFGFNSTL